jgi:hypothetical protein
LSTHSHKRFWKFCITRCSMLGEIAATSSLIFCLKSTAVLDFFLTPCSWDIPRGRSIATRDIRSDEYWSADEISTESQRQNRFFENRLHSENPILYRPALHENWNALTLARRELTDKFPTPMVPLTTVLANHQVQWRPLIIIADNVINRLLLSKSVVPKHSI